MGWIFKSFIALAIVLTWFLINFYRDPKRVMPKGSNIVAPADGRIISIISTSRPSIRISKGMFGKIKALAKGISKECCAVSIFMSPLDVHINRAPIGGKIISVKHTKGRFFKAYDLEKSLMNEKNEIVIHDKKLKVKVIQIAGFLARRIKCYVRPNEKVNKGAKIGMIALSSQTTVIMPNSVKLAVKIGDRVKAGETIIALIK